MIATLVIPHLRSMLSRGVALGLAGLLAACGGGSDAPPVSSPAPTPPGPTLGITYEVIPLNPRGETFGDVNRHAINAEGMVAGHNFSDEGKSRAFFYDGKRVIELGTFGGKNSVASGINRCGQVTGWAMTAEGIPHAFVYDGTLRDIGALGGESMGYAINDCGTITGWAAVPGGETHAFVYDGTMRDIGTLAGGTYSFALDINSRGIVAGYSDVAGELAFHAFIYDSKTGAGLQDLGTLGGDGSLARSINDAGQVAGWSFNAGGARRAFRYSGGVMQDLGTLDGTGSSEGLDINAAGKVIGNSFGEDSLSHGFIHDGTTMLDLGTLGGRFSLAVAINASGQVVGSSMTATDSLERAFSWTAEEGMVDLNTRLHEPPAGLHVIRALAVSDNGSIAALANTGLVLLKVRR